MRRTQKPLALFLVFVLVFALCGSAFAAQDKDIVILHTNDVHGEYAKNIGYAGLAAYKAEMEKTSYVTTVDAGDFSQGAAIAILSKGEYLVSIMNKVGYDIVVPGNHEFDYGMEQALKNLNSLDASVVSCNFVDLKTDKAVFDSYKLVEYGDTSVAYVGISTPETYTKSTPSYFQNANGNYIYSFSEGSGFYSTIQTSVDAAVAAGADYVVAIGHCGIDEQSSPWTSKEIIANTTGIDAFIDGHSHSTVENEKVANKTGEEVVLAQSGTALKAIGKLTIKADGTITAELVKDYAEKDPAVSEFISGIEAKYKEYTSQVVAKSEVDLIAKNPDGSWAVRNAETNMGDLIADAYRVVMGADVGIMNGGGIRANIAAGDVSIDNILAVMTFGNMATVVKATGQQILDCLEMGASAYPTNSGGFTHVSGITYTIDSRVASSVVKDDKGNFSSVSGEYRVRNVIINSQPLNLEKIYTVACHSYWLTQYGDGMTMFKGCEIVNEKHEKYVDNVMLKMYIQDELGGVIGKEYAEPQGRINIIKKITNVFSDVVEGKWYYNSVDYAYQKKLVVGLPGGVYGISDTMTVGQYLTVLYRMGVEMGAEYPTLDTTGTNWMEAARWMAKETGQELTDEQLLLPITRQVMAFSGSMFMKSVAEAVDGSFIEREVITFTDAADISPEYADYVNYFYAIGGIDGYPDGSFLPQGTATRAEVSRVFYNMLETASFNEAAA